MNIHMLGLVVVVALAGCGDRLADLDDSDDESLHVACAPITGWGYFEEGGQHVIFNENTGTAGTACLCMTEEEVASRSRSEELNDLMFAECTRLADVYSGNFDWDNCEEKYLSGIWPMGMSFAEGDVDWMNIDGLDCSDGGGPANCSVGDEPSPWPIGACALVGLVCLCRRRASGWRSAG